MKCPKCKVDNPRYKKYCIECGAALIDIPATLTSPPPLEKEEAPKKSALDFVPGEYFGKRYQIIEEIGRGGMGRVYKALDKELDRVVALKMIKPELSSKSGIVERFKKEIKLASHISHKNVCRIHDLGEVEGIKFISMQYIEGQDLNDFIKQTGKLPVERAIAITKQLCAALQAAHDGGVIHRDLKPQNIMIDKQGNAYVMDFGIARSLEAEQVTKPGAVIGTPHYMAPEQGEGKAADTSSDIYSLGCIIYEMLTGKPPFEADTSAALIHKHIKEKPEPPSKFNPQIPQALGMIILKCLEKEPDSRYPSAQELRLSLERLSAPVPSMAAPRLCRLTRSWLLISAGIILAVLVLLVGLNVGGLRDRLLVRTKPAPINSIAVLPLENLSGNPEQEYFADGMTDALITELGKISAVRVISRQSVMQYKETDKPLSEIARELNVDAVVEGSVLLVGEQVRITAQLIGAVPERHIWSQDYARNLSDILALQSEVAQNISREIKVKLTPEEESRLTSARPVIPEAYEAYLRGRYHLDKGTEEGYYKGLEYFQQAIEKDPTYALAYSGIADCYNFLAAGGYLFPKEAYPRAKAAAERALQIDDTLAEAHTSLARVRLMYDWDWLGAEREFKRAIELNPSYALAHQWYSVYLSTIEKHDEAIAEAKRAQELDLLSLTTIGNLGKRFYWARQYDRAIEQYKKVLEMEPNRIGAHYMLGWAYFWKGMHNEALAEQKKAVELAGPDNLFFLTDLAVMYSYLGRRDEAKKILDELLRLSEERYVFPTAIAFIYNGLNQEEKVFEWLEKAYEAHDDSMLLLKIYQDFDNIRSDPRFKDLLKRMNFPEN